MKLTLAASFAHLLGMAAKPAAAPVITAPPAKIEEDDDKRKEGESDDDYKKRQDAKKAAAQQRDGDEADAKRRAAEAEAEAERLDETEVRGESVEAKARARERARCRAIFVSPAAAGRPDLAATLAFDTKMTRAEAIAVLAEAGPIAKPEAAAPAKPTLPERMAGERIPEVLPDEEQQTTAGDPKALAARVTAAAERARGGKPATAAA